MQHRADGVTTFGLGGPPPLSRLSLTLGSFLSLHSAVSALVTDVRININVEIDYVSVVVHLELTGRGNCGNCFFYGIKAYVHDFLLSLI